MRELGKLRRQRVKVDVDVSGALKGLKTLRREADATLKAFREGSRHQIYSYDSHTGCSG